MCSSEEALPCLNCFRKNNSKVLFYEYVFRQETVHIDWLLEGKQKRLEKLQNIPADLLTDNQHWAMRNLEEEIKTIVGIFLLLDKMREAYLSETAAMAEDYWSVWIERQLLAELVGELRRDLTNVQERENIWIELFRQRITIPTNV